MEINQKCIVTNKSQLMSAVICAFDFYGVTEIILNKEDGANVYYKIQPRPRYQEAVKLGNLSCWKEFKAEFHKDIKRVLKNIRSTPAKYFK